MHITYQLPGNAERLYKLHVNALQVEFIKPACRSNYLSERCKGEIYLKFENMQRTVL